MGERQAAIPTLVVNFALRLSLHCIHISCLPAAGEIAPPTVTIR